MKEATYKKLSDKQKVLVHLIDKGEKSSDAKKMVAKYYDKVSKAYKNANIPKKAEIISVLSAKNEGSCGYGIDGKVGKEPAGPHLVKKKKKNESVSFLKKGIKAFVSEKMDSEQYHKYMQYVFDTQFKTPEEKKMKKTIIKKINVAQKKKGLSLFKGESVNEAYGDLNDSGFKKVEKYNKIVVKMVKKLENAVRHSEGKDAVKLIRGIYDAAGIMYDTIGHKMYYESVNEDLDPYKDFATKNNWEKEYDLNLGAFVDEYQKFMKEIKKLKPIKDENKRAWAHAIRKKVGKSMFNGYIGSWMKPIEMLQDFKKFEKLPDKAGYVHEDD